MAQQVFDVTTVEGRSTLWVDSERIEDCVSYYRDNNVDRLGVNPQRGYRGRDIEFLSRYPDVSALVLVGAAAPFDLKPLESLGQLRSLVISFASKDLSLEHFPALEEFRGYWHPGLHLECCKNIRILDLTGYAPKSKDLSLLPVFLLLEQLSMVQAGLTSLRGAARFKNLQRLELSHLSRLEELHDIEQLRSLEVLDCQKCRKLKNHDAVRVLTSLRILRFNDCGEIPSLSFLGEMSALEEFRFVNTNIVDGDLGPLLRLKRVGFLAKKHYSHTPEQLDAILRLRGGSAIARVE